MSKTVVLVVRSPDDPGAAELRAAIEGDPALRDRVDLRFMNRNQAQAVMSDVEVLCGGDGGLPGLLAAAPKLRWISYWSAGIDGAVRPEFLERGLLITNSSGVHGRNIAEQVLAFMLMFMRQMHLHMRSQVEGVWRRREGIGELTGQTLGIVGLGRIGEALTIRAQAFEMRVVAIKRDPHMRHNAAVQPDALYPPEELPRLLAESDHVCNALPYTLETHHLINAAMLAHMKPTAYFYNVGRGKTVDEAALIAALQNGKLAGAGLDVFEEEPLPPDSPLWRMENVILTPHMAGITPHLYTRGADMFVANLRRYLDGQPLHNLYDPVRGY